MLLPVGLSGQVRSRNTDRDMREIILQTAVGQIEAEWGSVRYVQGPGGAAKGPYARRAEATDRIVRSRA